MPNSFIQLRFPACLFAVLGLLVSPARADWRQWGGPQRNFHVSNVKLATSWPKSGPRQLWRRDLGDGYSSVLVADKQLVTMYRGGGREHVVSLHADTGRTLWTHSYDIQFLPKTNVKQFGPGPLATPLIVGKRVISVGVTGVLHCLSLDRGQVHWHVDLIRGLKGTSLFRGYSASPVAFRDLVILPVGGKGQGLIAFRVKDGSIAWKQHDFHISHVSPIIVKQSGQSQLVTVAAKMIAAVDPATGKRLWQHAHPILGDYVSSTPVFGNDGRLFFSAAYGNGSRCLDLLGKQPTQVKLRWHHRQMRIHHSNALRIGNVVYGTSGDFSVMLMMAVDIASGQTLWKSREPGRCRFVYADGKALVLREDGVLRLVSLSRKGMEVHATAKIFSGRGWTGPTLDRGRIYVRTRKEVMAMVVGD